MYAFVPVKYHLYTHVDLYNSDVLPAQRKAENI